MPVITQTMVIEHRVFSSVFDQIERRLPALETLAEMKLLADLMESLLNGHGEREENLSYAALDHMLAERGQFDCLYQDHKELDRRLAQIKTTQDLKEGRRLLSATIASARNHFRREEQIIFPLMEKVLQKSTLNTLGKAWAHPKQVPVAV